MSTTAQRLLGAIKAAVPTVTDVSIGRRGQPETVRVFPESEQAAAAATITAFDWTDAAQQAWEDDQHPDRKGIRQAAAAAVADNEAFLALASPNNAAVLAQVRRLTQQNNRIIKRLIQID